MEAVIQEFGLLGLLGLLVAQFVYTQMAGERSRRQMETRVAERLNERHERIVALMKDVQREKDSQILALRQQVDASDKRIEALEADVKAGNQAVETLTIELNTTKRELRTAQEKALQVPLMVAEITMLRSRLADIEAQLNAERALRANAEQRVRNLEQWNERATADNAVLIDRVNTLGVQNRRQADQIVALEQLVNELERKQSKAIVPVEHAPEGNGSGTASSDGAREDKSTE